MLNEPLKLHVQMEKKLPVKHPWLQAAKPALIYSLMVVKATSPSNLKTVKNPVALTQPRQAHLFCALHVNWHSKLQPTQLTLWHIAAVCALPALWVVLLTFINWLACATPTSWWPRQVACWTYSAQVKFA